MRLGQTIHSLGGVLFQVQLTLLTAIVKLFLKKPSETQELVQQVLSLATQVRHTHTHTNTSHSFFSNCPKLKLTNIYSQL